jgi:hypothetical protein
MSTITTTLKHGKSGLKGELTDRTREIIGHAIDNLSRQLSVLDQPGRDNGSSRPLIDLKENLEDFKSKEDKLTNKHFPSVKTYKPLASGVDGLNYGHNDIGKIQTVNHILELAVSHYS